MSTFTIEQVDIDTLETTINDLVSRNIVPPVVSVVRPDGYRNITLLENLADPNNSEHAYFIAKIDGNFVGMAAMAKFFDPRSQKTKVIHRLQYVSDAYHDKNIGPALLKFKATYCENNGWNQDDSTVHFSYLLTGYADDFLSISGWEPYTVERFSDRDFIGYRTTWGEYKVMPAVEVIV